MMPVRLARCPVCDVAVTVVADPSPSEGMALRIAMHGESAESRCVGSRREVELADTWVEGGTERERILLGLDTAQSARCAWCRRRRRRTGDHYCAECRAELEEARRARGAQGGSP